MRVTQKKLNSYHEKAIRSNIIQSARRIIFTHCSEPMSTTGFYHADQVYSGGGSGILIKYQQKFFLLTAKHVLDANYSTQQNESPFFTHVFSKNGWSDISGLLLPMREWKIGELIREDIEGIEMQDISLIELSSMILDHPDKYIDLDSKNAPKGIAIKNMQNGMQLLASGYPIDKNPIEYGFSDEYNCAATINKHIYTGTCEIKNSTPTLSLINKLSHAELNGISGGAVSNIAQKSNKTEWVGMIQRAGGGLIRFYPASLIIPAIKNYQKANYCTIDPAAEITDLEIENSKIATDARKTLYKQIKSNTARKMSKQLKKDRQLIFQKIKKYF